jgi:hypothetical protein
MLIHSFFKGCGEEPKFTRDGKLAVNHQSDVLASSNEGMAGLSLPWDDYFYKYGMVSVDFCPSTKQRQIGKVNSHGEIRRGH